MLVLTRKQGESIQIGEDIKITLLSFKKGAARLGVNCPREIRVLRNELTEDRADSESPCLPPQILDFCKRENVNVRSEFGRAVISGWRTFNQGVPLVAYGDRRDKWQKAGYDLARFAAQEGGAL